MSKSTAWRFRTTLMVALPGSALLIGVLVFFLAWSSLPFELPVHWWMDGAVDAWSTRAWVVGGFLAMSGAATAWVTFCALVAPRRVRSVFDVAVVAALLSWIGLHGLLAAIWPVVFAPVSTWVLVGIVLPGLLAYGVHRMVLRSRDRCMDR